MTDPNHGLIESLLSHLYQHRAEDHYRATLREIRLRLDRECQRLWSDEAEAGYAGQPNAKERE